MIKSGIILAGGNGTRLRPLTDTTNKGLLKVNDKRIIDYPLHTLKEMGCEHVTVVLGGQHYGQVVEYLKDGEAFGLNLSFVFQQEPKGIAQAINLCKQQVKNDEQFVVILGDNLFEKPISWNLGVKGAQIVLDLDKMDQEEIKRFGVASIADKKRLASQIVRLEEKPKRLANVNDVEMKPLWDDYDIIHNYPICGCYLFDSRFFDYFQQLTPSARGEYEVLDILQHYHRRGLLSFTWNKDSLWIDAGTHESLRQADEYFRSKNNEDR